MIVSKILSWYPRIGSVSPGSDQVTIIEVFEDKSYYFVAAENLLGTEATDRMTSAEGFETPWAFVAVSLKRYF